MQACRPAGWTPTERMSSVMPSVGRVRRALHHCEVAGARIRREETPGQRVCQQPERETQNNHGQTRTVFFSKTRIQISCLSAASCSCWHRRSRLGYTLREQVLLWPPLCVCRCLSYWSFSRSRISPYKLSCLWKEVSLLWR